MPLAVLWLLSLALLDDRSVAFLHPVLPGDYQEQINTREKTVLEGDVLSAPEMTEEGVRFTLLTRRVAGVDLPPVKTRVTFGFVPGDLPDRDDHMVLKARLKRPSHYQDPGVFDYRRALERKGILLSAFIGAPEDLQGVDQASPSVLSLEPMRRATRDLLFENLSPDPAAFLTALVVGDQSGISGALWDSFRKTGTAHLIAISGQHVALVATLAFVMILALLKHSETLMLATSIRKLAGMAAIPPVIFYTLLAGAPPSAVRAMILAVLFFTARLFRRQADAWSSLAFAALIMTAIDPAVAFSASFQLSFLAVAGMILAHRVEVVPDGESWAARCWRRYVKRTFRYTLAATLATAPLAAYLFHQVSLSGILTNLWAIPAVSALLILMVALPLLGLLPGIHVYYFRLLDLLAGGFLDLLQRSADLSWVASYYPTGLQMLLAYLVLVMMVLAMRMKKYRWIPAVAAAVMLFLLLLPRFLPLTDRLEVTFLDVGQGDAAFILTPSGKSLLMDGGGSYLPAEMTEGEKTNAFDIGERVVVPSLKWRGLRRIDALLLSHPHPDHFGGFRAVVRNFPVGEFWSTGETSRDPRFEELMSSLEEHQIPRKSLRTGDRFSWNGLEIEVIHPPFLKDKQKINDHSLVVRISQGNFSALFPGDIEKEGEEAVTARSPSPVTLLKVPHHASRTSSSVPFVDAFLGGEGLRFAVASLSDGNPFGFPHEGVLEKYERRGVRVFRTDRDGAVTFRVPSDFPTQGISIQTETSSPSP